MVHTYSGIPGSGKSTLAKKNHPKVPACSADDFFMEGDEYRFDRNRLGQAHGFCLRLYLNNILCYKDSGIKFDIVVDNTNTTNIELAPYVALAQAYEIPLMIYTIKCDPELAASRNVHGVPRSSVLRMHERLMKRQLPSHWPHTWVEVNNG